MSDALPVKVTADNAHIPNILRLIKQSFAYMDSRIDPPSSQHRLTLASIKDHCSTGEVWIVGSPPDACVFLTKIVDKLYIGKLAVANNKRGLGFARQLIDLAEKRAVSKGISVLELETRIELVENHEAFRRLGFIKTGEGRHDGFDRPTYIIMRKAV